MAAKTLHKLGSGSVIRRPAVRVVDFGRYVVFRFVGAIPESESKSRLGLEFYVSLQSSTTLHGKPSGLRSERHATLLQLASCKLHSIDDPRLTYWSFAITVVRRC